MTTALSSYTTSRDVTQLDKEKWGDLLGNLREDLKDKQALFRLVYLVDDFAGTGTSFFRYNEKKQKWSGKLWRFKDSIESARQLLGGTPFDPNWELCVHHYIASSAAAQAIGDLELPRVFGRDLIRLPC